MFKLKLKIFECVLYFLKYWLHMYFFWHLKLDKLVINSLDLNIYF